jgi:2-(1,2-epoxy-1,2-dihydrophenyl)acetyl-CoA isomerase
MTADGALRLEDAGDGVARIVISRAHVKNSLRVAEMRALGGLVRTASERARCVLVTGEGGSFCAGRDLSEADPEHDDTLALIRDSIHPTIAAVHDCPVPTIAAVDGPALGFGFGLALACDLTIVADDARLGSPFRNIGCVPDSGAHWFMAQRIGRHRALELIYTGTLLSGREAARIGLVNRSIAGAALADTAAALARAIAAGPPLAFRASKDVLARQGSLADALELEAHAQAAALRSADGAEGIRAFQQKRPPRFTGH